MDRASAELDTASWQRVLTEAAALGVLQVHFSGGEPTVRRDLLDLVGHANEVQLYSNLITSGVTLTAPYLAALRTAGLDHIQLSFQDADSEVGDRIGGMPGGHARKLAAARLIREAGFPLTANFVVHRQNLERLPAMIALGEGMGAGRIEVAHVQYYGWGLLNRDALLPTPTVRSTRPIPSSPRPGEGCRAALVIDYVTPDYYAARPKSCMGGWGRQFLNVTPSGRVLPCHAAETLTDLTFPSVRDASLGGDLAQQPGVPALPWHGMDARTLPQLRPAGGRLGRLPLPGLRTDRATPPPPTRPARCRPTTPSWRPPWMSARSEDFVYRRIGGSGITQAPVTRQITSPTSSAISRERPSAASVTPTGTPVGNFLVPAPESPTGYRAADRTGVHSRTE